MKTKPLFTFTFIIIPFSICLGQGSISGHIVDANQEVMEFVNKGIQQETFL